MHDLIAAHIRAAAEREAAIIEEWCEKSLVDPEGRGVLVIHMPVQFDEGDAASNSFSAHREMRIGLSETVPFGQIHVVHL